MLVCPSFSSSGVPLDALPLSPPPPPPPPSLSLSPPPPHAPWSATLYTTRTRFLTPRASFIVSSVSSCPLLVCV
jgi:hypothetical protein